MAEQSLSGKIVAYLKRAKEEGRVYPLGDVGIFKVVGGNYGSQRYVFNELYEGQFVDVLKFAFQQERFYDEELGTNSDIGDKRNGYVIKADENDLNKFERTRILPEPKKELKKNVKGKWR